MPKTEVTGKNIKDSSVDLTVDVTGILPVANGGTGSTTMALNNVILGNGTGAVQTVAPSTVGNLLISNGTTWQASRTVNAPSGTDPLTIQNNGSTVWTFSQFGELFGAGGTGFYTDGHISAAAVASTGTLNLSSGVGKSSGSYDIVLTPYNNGVINLKSTTVQANGVAVLTTGGALGTPASGTLTNCTSLPVSGITASTSTALGVGSIELGHASDTTVTRAAAGRLAVEGINVVTTSSSDTLTGKTLNFASGNSNTISNVPTSALSINGAATAGASATESTTSTSFADLTTTTDSVTVTIGASGLALVSISAMAYSSISTGSCDVGFAVSGANTLGSGDDNRYLRFSGALTNASGATYLLTGLTAGSSTFKLKYRQQNGGTASFLFRRIAVVPL